MASDPLNISIIVAFHRQKPPDSEHVCLIPEPGKTTTYGLDYPMIALTGKELFRLKPYHSLLTLATITKHSIWVDESWTKRYSEADLELLFR